MSKVKVPFGLGSMQSPPDYRDIPLAAVSPIAGAYPSSGEVDISKLPVWMQNKIGACTGHAGGKYKQKMDLEDTGQVYPLSARFLYAIAKCQDGVADEGTYPRLIAATLKNYGCATEKTCPNDTTLDHETYVYQRKLANIPKAAFDEAGPYKISGYAFPNVTNPDELKDAILNHSGAMILVRLGQEWWTPSWSAKDILPLRAPASIVGGHEVYLYKYEVVTENGKERIKFYILNSWSDKWGDSGKGWFYYDEYSPYINEAITFTDIPTHIIDQLQQLPTKETFRHNFTKVINYRNTGSEVAALQTALMIDGCFSSDMYSKLLAENALGYYGTITANAVICYQKKHSVASLAEINYLQGKVVGPKTLASLNSWTNL